MATPKILSGVKKINFTPWKADDTGLDTANAMSLDNVIADTVALAQDDPETNDIDCETRDEPIYSATTLGKYNITMDSADINDKILTNCMGYTKEEATGALFAPTAYTAKYAQIEIEFDDTIVVLPRVLLNSKFDASSLKTGVAKGTIAGTAYSCDIKVGTGAKTSAPLFVVDKTGTNKTWVVSPLNTTGE